MADTTKIEWARHPLTDLGATWNPITGCSLVSEGCRHCYAARLAGTRMKNHPSRQGLARQNAAGEWKFTGEVRFNEQWFDQPLRWKKPRGIFVCAHGDLFHENAPDEWIDKVFAVMALCPQHVFFVLTKRPESMPAYLERRNPNGHHPAMDTAALVAATGRVNTPAFDLRTWPLPNVWLGTSIEDQTTADTRLPYLLATPAARRFISAEPLLGPVDLTDIDYVPFIDSFRRTPRKNPADPNWPQLRYNALTGHLRGPDDVGLPKLDWVIAGGESGHKARPTHPDWVRLLRDQCAAADVPFFFKQWGNHAPASIVAPGDHLSQDADIMLPSGKSAAGRLLDGVTYDAMPDLVR